MSAIAKWSALVARRIAAEGTGCSRVFDLSLSEVRELADEVYGHEERPAFLLVGNLISFAGQQIRIGPRCPSYLCGCDTCRNAQREVGQGLEGGEHGLDDDPQPTVWEVTRDGLAEPGAIGGTDGDRSLALIQWVEDDIEGWEEDGTYDHVVEIRRASPDAEERPQIFRVLIQRAYRLEEKRKREQAGDTSDG